MEAWSDIWRALRRLSWGLLAMGSVILLAEGVRLVQGAAALHPAAGWAVGGLLAGAVYLYVAAPLARLLSWRPATPRPLPAAAAVAWRSYGSRLLAERRPWTGGEEVEVARLLPLATDAESAKAAVMPLCRALDAAGRAAVERAAVKTFALTALSQRPAWDAVAVLAVQAGMVADIARVYRERPSLADLGGLGRRVVVAAGVAGGLDALGDHAAQAILRSWSGAMQVVASSVAQGLLNAFLTLRLGEVARQAAAGQASNPAAASWWALGRLSLLPVQGMAGAAGKAATSALRALAQRLGREPPPGEGRAEAPLAPLEA